jgi:hypothetical protein
MFKLLLRAVSHIIGDLKTANENQIWLTAEATIIFNDHAGVLFFNSSLAHRNTNSSQRVQPGMVEEYYE